MVNRIAISFALFLFIVCLPLKSLAKVNPDSTGLPGDNLDLAAVLDLFKSSSTLEDFEKKLNTKDNHINNLDLDGDNHVDYIRVVDNMKDKIHAIVLKVPVNATESQDVAVIEIEKKGDQSAQLQIVGDEELYGEKYIVEPNETTKKDSLDGKWGGFAPQVYVVNVWYWPCVQYVYYPGYIIWVSPWYWMYWPYWWSPWNPYPYYVYYGYVYYYHDYYYCTDEYRIPEAHGYYGPRRVVAPSVHRKYEAAQVAHKEQVKNNKAQQTKPEKPTTQQPAPQKPNVQTQPPVQQQPTPQKPNVQPQPPVQQQPPVQPAPTPRPNVQPAPTPRPNVQPAPTPRPNVQPTPAPRPKGGSRPRMFRKKGK